MIQSDNGLNKRTRLPYASHTGLHKADNQNTDSIAQFETVGYRLFVMHKNKLFPFKHASGLPLSLNGKVRIAFRGLLC